MRESSDEFYVLDICDEILGEIGCRQETFPFLKGDTGKLLPVDIFYPNKKLVIEYREKQHYKEIPFFDKNERITVSGVPRNIQRKIYDKRREEVLPQHGIDIVIIPFYELDVKNNGKLNRNIENDKKVILMYLCKYIDND